MNNSIEVAKQHNFRERLQIKTGEILEGVRRHKTRIAMLITMGAVVTGSLLVNNPFLSSPIGADMASGSNSEKVSVDSRIQNLIAYRNADGVLVTHDLSNDEIKPVPSPEPGINNYVISADLSTYAWFLPQIMHAYVPEGEERQKLEPWQLMVKLPDQESKRLLTFDGLRVAARKIFNLGDDRMGPFPWNLSLSSAGDLLSVDPLSVGASAWFYSLTLRPIDGVVIDNECALADSVLSPDGKMLLGVGKIEPGVQYGRAAGICVLSTDEEAIITGGQLEKNLQELITDRDETAKNVPGGVAYTTDGGSWSKDGKALIYVLNRKEFDPLLGQCSFTANVVLVTPGGVKTVYSRTLDQYPLPEYELVNWCRWPESEATLSSPALSADGQSVVYEEFDGLQSSIWSVKMDGSSRYKIANGSSPFWVASPKY